MLDKKLKKIDAEDDPLRIKKDNIYTSKQLKELGWSLSHGIGFLEVWTDKDGDMLFFDPKTQKVDNIFWQFKPE